MAQRRPGEEGWGVGAADGKEPMVNHPLPAKQRMLLTKKALTGP